MAATIDFGIDLGTTNSSIALCRGGEVRVFQSTDLMNVTPSVVYVSKSGRMLVGKKAYDIWAQDPENSQAEFKRWMGFKDKLKFPAADKELSAEELSAEVLKSLRADAERQTQEKINAAVITVPAAFGSLQCEATGRAAKLAGFEHSPLLQEPIAAAVAYGASPSARDQRWMVFDLGGGTLDIAVISTRNSRLAVLEHQGNNRLGGKDIDRLITQSLLLSPLSQAFALPDAKESPAAFNRLMRVLIRHAENAKIALSSAMETTVELFDAGQDRDGKPIELSIPLKRSDVEQTIAPVIQQCIELAHRALNGARLAGKDLDRVLLVGGPTQMPILRDALTSALGAKLDCSLDPMTVVAYGAALYASTLENPCAAAPAPASHSATNSKAVKIQLAYERASGTPQSPVAGLLDANCGVAEVKIDAAGGYWTSGWVPVTGGCFQLEVMLHNVRPVTHFSITARDGKGNPVAVEPAEFDITYMLPMGAPPLPHAIAVELSTINGQTKMDPVFQRHCPLPAQVRKTYKAERTLRPSEAASSLPIKFWEIEVSDDPQEKWWAGCVNVRADWIRRPIPEGSDLDLLIKIDASRKISVELFVPLLNQSFTHEVYIPDPPSAHSQLVTQMNLCFERLNFLGGEIYRTDRTDLTPRFEQLQAMAERIAERIVAEQNSQDPDASLKPTAELRQLRMQLTQLEEQIGIDAGSQFILQKLHLDVPYVRRVIQIHGSETDRQQFTELEQRFQRYEAAKDVRGLNWLREQLITLHDTVVHNQLPYWREVLFNLKQPQQRFLNRGEAMKAFQEADAADARGDLNGLRSACHKLFRLKPKSQLETAAEQAALSGLRAQ